MSSKRKLIFALALTFVLGNISPLFAQSSPNIPIDDPVYRDIDRLVGLGLANDVIYGQRPWSRAEVARIISKALSQYQESPLTPDDREISLHVETNDLLERLKTRFQEEISSEKRLALHPLSFVQAEYTFVDADARDVPTSNGLGAIDALTSPLTAYREGRHYPDGHQFAVETEHYATLTRFFSIYARPRFQLEIRDNRDVQLNPFVQQLYGKFTVPHFELEVGRDSIEWGQGEFGGVLLSNNARPLDMIKLSNPSPTILPWLFKYLGPFRYTFFVANLGPEREFSDSFLTGLKLSIKPAAFFEMGFSQIMMLGGQGAPGPITAGNAIGEFFGHRSGNGNLTNRETGFDFRFYIPPWHNMQIYVDAQFEDDSKDRLFQITDLGNYQAGLYFPILTASGASMLRLEYRHSSPYFYRHSPFTTGMTLNRRLLGDDLGPQADGAYATFSYEFSDKMNTIYTLAYERRDGDLITQIDIPKRHVEVVTPAPAEHRVLIDVLGQYSFNPRCHLDVELGYQLTQNFNFTTKATRSGILLTSSLRFDLF